MVQKIEKAGPVGFLTPGDLWQPLATRGLLTFLDRSLLTTSWNRMVFSGGGAQI